MLTLKSLVSSFLYTEKIRKNIYDQQFARLLIRLPLQCTVISLSILKDAISLVRGILIFKKLLDLYFILLSITHLYSIYYIVFIIKNIENN